MCLALVSVAKVLYAAVPLAIPAVSECNERSAECRHVTTSIASSGTPDWMLNVSTLNALPFPEPLTFNGSKLIHPDARSGAYPNITCGCVPSAACDQARAFGIFAAYG